MTNPTTPQPVQEPAGAVRFQDIPLDELAAKVREIFDFDPATGILTWKAKRRNVVPGRKAGYFSYEGYLSARFLGQVHTVHRLGWLHHFGQWPKGMIDHINGDRADNRMSNLRDVTCAQNQWNRVVETGHVRWYPKDKRWRVGFRLNGKQMHFGTFVDKADAEACAAQAVREHRGEFARSIGPTTQEKQHG